MRRSRSAVACVIGFLAIRTRGIYFSMVTLALAQMCLLHLLQWRKRDRRRERPARHQRFDHQPVRLPSRLHRSGEQVLRDARLSSPLRCGCSRASSRRRSAPCIEAMRENEARAAACGYDVATRSCWPSCCRAHSAAWPARCARCICPSCRSRCCTISTSGHVVMMALLGRHGHLLRAVRRRRRVPAAWQTCSRCGPRTGSCIVGAIFIVFVLFFPRGIWGSILHWSWKQQSTRCTEIRAVITHGRSHPCSSNDIWARRRQAVRRLRGAERRHASVSPRTSCRRSSGRTAPARAPSSTCYPAPSRRRAAASIFEGRDITACRSTLSRACGIAKSFQITNVFPQLSAHENVRVAAQMQKSRYDMWRRARACAN